MSTLDYDPKIASMIQLKKTTESLDALMTNRNISYISPLMRASNWTGHLWSKRINKFDADADHETVPPDLRASSEPRGGVSSDFTGENLSSTEVNLQAFQKRREAMTRFRHNTKHVRRSIPKASERLPTLLTSARQPPTPSFRLLSSSPSAFTTNLSQSTFVALRGQSFGASARDMRPPLERASSLSRGASQTRATTQSLSSRWGGQAGRSGSVDRAASVERSESLERSASSPQHHAPYHRRFIPHYKTPDNMKGSDDLRNSLRVEREKRRTNATQQHGNRKFKNMTKEARNDYMRVLGASAGGNNNDHQQQHQHLQQHQEHQHQQQAAADQQQQQAILEEALRGYGTQKENKAPPLPPPPSPLAALQAENKALRAALAGKKNGGVASEEEDGDAPFSFGGGLKTGAASGDGTFRVEFGEGPMGFAFDLNEGHTDLVVTQSEGAAKAKGVLEGDLISEVNGTALPLDFTEEDLFDMLTQAERPVAIGFQRSEGGGQQQQQTNNNNRPSNNDGEDDAFYERFTALDGEGEGRER